MSILAIVTMSGTSLEVIDIAHCRFSDSGNQWSFEIKEVLIFAFPGVLSHQGKINVPGSVTGARQDNIDGIIYRI